METKDKLLKWEELSQDAKEYAIQKYKETGFAYDWWDSVYEMCIEDGKEMGFDIETINFSGFWSQGDGARWLGMVDLPRWFSACGVDSIGISAWQQLALEGVISTNATVESYGGARYCHENTMRVSEVTDLAHLVDDGEVMERASIFKGMTVANLFDIIATDTTCPYKTTEELTEAIEESAKDYACTIYKRLQEEYDYLTSDEAIAETIQANDYNFTNEGELA